MSGAFHKSAEELQFLRRKLTQGQLPYRGGPKDSVPDGSEEQAERLEQQLEQYEENLSEERILRKGNMSVGKWNRDERVAEIEISKGVHWHVFGKRVGGRLILEPEEALYMVDHEMLELYYCDLPMSVQQAYEMILSDAFPLHYYVVYSYLRNLGFIVLRHERKSSSVDLGEETQKPGEERKELLQRKAEGNEEKSEAMKETVEDKLQTEKEETIIGNTEGKMQEHMEERMKNQEEKFGIMREEIEDTIREEMKAEMTAKTEEKVQEQFGEKIKDEKEVEKEEKGRKTDDGSVPVPPVDENSPVSHYWKDERCQPLVHPSDATSLENILSKLQIIKSQPAMKTSQPLPESCRFEIIYDVFQPQKNFKKTNPGLPNHSICICKFTDIPPSVGEMNLLSRASYPVPLKYAVVDCKDVSFYSMLDVQLPTYVEG